MKELDRKERKTNVGEPDPSSRRVRQTPVRGINVLFVDDELMLRQLFRPLLTASGFRIVGEASNGREAIELAEKLLPDVVVLDVLLPDLDGIDAAFEIHRRHPQIGIVIITAHSDSDRVVRSLKSGALGFVWKGAGFEELPAAIAAVAKGRLFISPACDFASENTMERITPRISSLLHNLTQRQIAVLQLIAEEKTNKEIAAALQLSIKTVEKHRTALTVRLGIRTTAGLARFAVRAGLVM